MLTLQASGRKGKLIKSYKQTNKQYECKQTDKQKQFKIEVFLILLVFLPLEWDWEVLVLL